MFGELIIGYLFLGGVGAGACFVLGLLTLLVPSDAAALADAAPLVHPRVFSGAVPVAYETRVARTRLAYGRLFVPAFGWALVVLCLSAVFLMADLGRVDRLLLVLVQPTLSHIAVGAYALLASIVLALVLLLVWSGVGRAFPLVAVRVVCVLMMVACAAVMVYAGLLLYSMPAVPLWTTPWLPVLFVLSALSGGMALVLASVHMLGAVQSFGAVCRRLMRADVVILLLEALALAAFAAACAGMLAKSGNPTEVMAAASAFRLLSGDLAPLFWGAFAGCGLAAPLVLEVVSLRMGRVPSQVALAAAVLVLAGGLALRYCLVQAGTHPLLL